MEEARDDRSVQPLVEMHDVTKAFGAQVVLEGVSYDVLPGEVHVLAGENGAGKSTLIKILAGIHTDYQGHFLLAGRPRRFKNPIDARTNGVAVIHQELSLVGPMSVADNLFLGRELRTPLGTLARHRQQRAAAAALQSMGLDIDVRRPLAAFPISVQQLVEIARAMLTDSRVVVMDEPTSALNEHEANRLFERIELLQSRGTGVVYITHKLSEIYRLADRITVLRDGVRIGTADRASLPRERLLRWMVGRELRDVFPARGTAPGDVVLEVKHLEVADPVRRGKRLVDDLSFVLRAGEILGLAGLQGSGTSHVLHALFGDARARGRATLGGEELRVRSPRGALRRGIALLTNDRKTSGIVPAMSVVENATLAGLRALSPWGRLDRKREAAATEAVGRRLKLGLATLPRRIDELSGGNQQKVVLARWLLTQPNVMLLDEPTRGIDVGAKADIYALMREHVAAGGSILLITSEMEELLGLCDRILVLHRGRLSAEMDAADATQQAILHAAMEEREAAPWRS